MKKEEFPTFLNEQPTVAFGRTTRELLLILLGLTLAYLVWLLLGRVIGDDFGSRIIKGLFAIIPLGAMLAVAFVQIASRPLEVWGLIGVMYFFTPKVFTYDPNEELDQAEDTIDIEQYQLTQHSNANDEW